MARNTMRTNLPQIESYMQRCMRDSAHDTEHVYRVLNYALDIAKHEGGADFELLTTACLLHDISRTEQFADPTIDHAIHGSLKAHGWLVENGYSAEFADAVRGCIETHRFRSDNPPRNLEAKILFDADKLDVCGAVGIARTLLYKSHVIEPLYSFTAQGEISDGTEDTGKSFMQEYKFKLEGIYDKFYTQRGFALAAKRKSAAQNFYDSLLSEVRECYSEATL